MDLPAEKCITRYKDYNNNDLIEFDLSYFTSIHDETMRERAFAAFPKEFKKAYNRYQKSGSLDDKYYLVPAGIGICFTFYGGGNSIAPMFLNIIPSILDYDEARATSKDLLVDEVKKIIVQKVPHLTTGELLFEPPEAEELHAGAVGMLKHNKNTSVLTTYCDVDAITSEGNSNTNTSKILDGMSNAVANEAGVSMGMFNSSGNMALGYSTKNDLAFMMPIAHKFANFFTNLLNLLFANNSISFKYTILPISYYNENEYLDNTYKMATTGYSFLLPAITVGLSQSDLGSIKDLENDVLKLSDKLIPLKSSYTDSANAQDEGGRPTVKEEDKTDGTVAKDESTSGGGGENG